MIEKKEIDWNLYLSLSVIAGFAVLIGVAAWHRRFLTYGVETDFIWRYKDEAALFLARKPLQLTYHPPLYTILLALVYGLIRDWARAGFFISWMAGVCTAYFNWHAYRRLLGPYAAWGSLVGLVSSAMFLVLTASASSDILALSLHSLCFFLTVRALESRLDRDWQWAGAAAGAAIMTRVETFPLLLLGCAAWRRGERFGSVSGKALRFLAGAVVLPAVWLTYALATGSRLFPKDLVDILALSFSPLTNDRFTGDALSQVSVQFSSVFSMLGHDPRGLAGIVLDNFRTIVIQNQARLLTFPLNTCVLPGFFLLWFHLCRRGIWTAVVLLSPFLIQTAMLSFIVYNPRYHVFMIPLMGAGVGLCVKQARKLLPRAQTGGERAALVAPALIILVPLLFAGVVTLRNVSKSLHSQDAELEEAVPVTRERTPEDAVLVARKPHIGFYAGRKLQIFPAAKTLDELREGLRSMKTKMPVFVYYGSAERESRPELAALRFAIPMPPWLWPVAAGRKNGDWALYRYLLKRKEFPQALEAAKQAAHLEKSPRTYRQLYAVYREM